MIEPFCRQQLQVCGFHFSDVPTVHKLAWWVTPNLDFTVTIIIRRQMTRLFKPCMVDRMVPFSMTLNPKFQGHAIIRHWSSQKRYKMETYNGILIYIFIHHNMIERTEQKVQQKSTHKKEKNNNNNRTSYTNLHITFSHDRYFATNFLIRFSTTVLGRSNSNCARQ